MSEALPKKMDVPESNNPALRICIVYSRCPFPMMRGDQLTVANLISFLYTRGHKVDLLTLDNDGFLTKDQRNWLSDCCANVYLVRYSLIRKFVNLVRGFLLGLPLQVALFNSRRQKIMLKKLDREHAYDIIYTYYLRSAEIGKQFYGKNILALQLSQYLNTFRIYQKSKNLLMKFIYLIESELLKKYEPVICSKYTKVGIIGPKDLESINQSLKKQQRNELENYFFSPHGTDIGRFKTPSDEDIVSFRIVFSGNMSYEPNVQAAEWFVNDCFDRIIEKVPNAELYIVGKQPKPSVRKLAKSNIIVTGTVKDPYEYIKTATVCINPVKAAGGMQNKLIEYMASGKVTVSTSIANEGIGAPTNSVIIADGSKEFSEKVIEVLLSPENFSEMKKKARQFVEKEWTWESHFLKLEKEFYQTIART